MFIVIPSVNKTSCTPGLEADTEEPRGSGTLSSFLSCVPPQLRSLNFCQAKAPWLLSVLSRPSVAAKFPEAHAISLETRHLEAGEIHPTGPGCGMTKAVVPPRCPLCPGQPAWSAYTPPRPFSPHSSRNVSEIQPLPRTCSHALSLQSCQLDLRGLSTPVTVSSGSLIRPRWHQKSPAFSNSFAMRPRWVDA